MKVGSIVFAAHVAVAGVFFLTQGCVTTEQSTSRYPAARHKAPWRHHGRTQSMASQQLEEQSVQGIPQSGDGQMIEPIMVEPVFQPTAVIATEPVVAPIAPPARPAYKPSTGIHVVQKGDTLSGIAASYDSTTPTLIALNNLSNPNRLYIGQQIKVPGGARTASASSSRARSTSVRTVMGGEKYVIQKGDTLSHIAVRFGVSIGDLRAVNNLGNDFIRAGETLTIPKHGKLQQAKTPTAAKPETVVKEPVVADVPQPEPLEVAEPVTIEPRVINVAAVEEKVMYPGETLDDVARQYGVSKSEIMRLNNIADETTIQEGQRIRIPIAE
ncbi:MAG: LysM peptidoglycan-binding domain-containing protein [Kiritimatiellales bacterium]|nr:LysM peptidoglycan-binding domain-containing protein [Kiritimatiellales bacterium]